MTPWRCLKCGEVWKLLDITERKVVRTSKDGAVTFEYTAEDARFNREVRDKGLKEECVGPNHVHRKCRGQVFPEHMLK